MLNGKKSAFGIIGALASNLLSPTTVVGADGVVKTIKPVLVNSLTMLEPLMAFAPGMQPVFLALAAWGFLGKMEKWSGPANSPTPRNITRLAASQMGEAAHARSHARLMRPHRWVRPRTAPCGLTDG